MKKSASILRQSFEIGPGHKGAQKKQKIYNKVKAQTTLMRGIPFSSAQVLNFR